MNKELTLEKLYQRVKKKMDFTSGLNFQFINTPAQLTAVGNMLESQMVVAVDLEADSMFHFHERICLLQMSTNGFNGVIDPLQIDDLSPLKPFFADPSIKKIFHGSDYDIRSLYRDFGIRVNNLFDTELACRFLGMAATGLDAVLQKKFHIRLDKKFQKKDWSRRPLPPEMIEYAACDAVHLIALADGLETELDCKRRLSWVREECEFLSRVRPAQIAVNPLFLRFKGAGKLDRRSLAVLEALLQVRQEIAAKLDRPPFKVFGSATLMSLVQHRPDSLERLKDIKALSSKQMHMGGHAVVAAIRSALGLPADRLPVYPRQPKPTQAPEISDRIKALKVWRQDMALTLGLEPGLLFNKGLLAAIATRNPRRPADLKEIEGLRNWQRHEFGRGIVAALRS
jgi:ribonuclease D